MREGNLISFNVFVNSKGVLMTEYSEFPLSKVNSVFNKDDIPLIKKILNKASSRLEGLHKEIENELIF